MNQTLKHRTPKGSCLTSTLIQRMTAKKSLLTGSALLLASLAGFSTAAEKSEAPNWYQIELLVFTQPLANIQAEYWQESLQPKFDYNAIQLRPSDGFEFEHPNNTILKSEQANRLSRREATPLETEFNSPESGSNLDAGLNPHPLQPRQLPTPLLQEYSDGAFTLLNKEQLEQQAILDAAADIATVPSINTRLLERKGHRILFQGQWRQPVYPREAARSIVIRGGEALAPDYFELEGDIQLSLSRYLHLRPNLYLTLALPPEWQPRNPHTLDTRVKTRQAAQEAATANSADPQPALLPSLQSGPLSRSLSGSATADPQAKPQLLAPKYLRLHLDQSRRMRRNELHYLDHPLFGVLIRITAYTPEVVLPKETALPLGNRSPATAVSDSDANKATSSTTGAT